MITAQGSEALLATPGQVRRHPGLGRGGPQHNCRPVTEDPGSFYVEQWYSAVSSGVSWSHTNLALCALMLKCTSGADGGRGRGWGEASSDRISLRGQSPNGSSAGLGGAAAWGLPGNLAPSSVCPRVGGEVWGASPEGRVGERVRGQVAGVVVGRGGGRVQAQGRQGGHAEVLGGVVGPETPQVVLCHRAGGHHVVHGPLQAAGGTGRGRKAEVSPRPGNGPTSRHFHHASLTRTGPGRRPRAQVGSCCSLGPPSPLPSSPSGRRAAIRGLEGPLAPGAPDWGFRVGQTAEPAVGSAWKWSAGADGAEPPSGGLGLSWCGRPGGQSLRGPEPSSRALPGPRPALTSAEESGSPAPPSWGRCQKGRGC